MSSRDDYPVTFLTPTGAMEIRMSNCSIEEFRAAALTLRARYFIAVWDVQIVDLTPIWGVFEPTPSKPPTTTQGRPVQAPPIKTFTTRSSAPAVMFASMRGTG